MNHNEQPFEDQSTLKSHTRPEKRLTDFGIKPDPRTGKYNPELKTVAGLYLLILAINLLVMRGYFLSTDHVAVYRVAQSLVEDHDLSIDALNDAYLGPDGRYYCVFGPLQSILSIPFYLVGTWMDRYSGSVLRTYWSGTIVDIWRGTVSIYFVSTFNQFVIPLVCCVNYLFGRQLGFARRHAIATSLILAFGTLAWSQAIDYYQHPLESLWLLLTIYILFSNRNNLQERHAWLAGIFLGLGVLTRINLILLYPVLAIYLWNLSGRSEVTRLRAVKLAILQSFSLPFLLALVTTLYLNQLRFGGFMVFNPVFGGFGWVHPIWKGIYGYFFSLGRSIFLYSPPLLLALGYWPTFFRRYKHEARLFIGIFLIYLATYAFSANWAGGWSWGPRYFLAILPLILLALGYCWEARRHISLAIILTLLGACNQVLGIVVNYSYIHGDWEQMGFTYPAQEYIFIPDVSPIAMHLRALVEGRYIDTWLFGVFQRFGSPVFLVSLVLPLSIFISGVYLLRKQNAQVQ